MFPDRAIPRIQVEPDSNSQKRGNVLLLTCHYLPARQSQQTYRQCYGFLRPNSGSFSTISIRKPESSFGAALARRSGEIPFRFRTRYYELDPEQIILVYLKARSESLTDLSGIGLAQVRYRYTLVHIGPRSIHMNQCRDKDGVHFF